MTYSDKVVKLPDFLGQVRGRLELGGQTDALIYFDTVLKTGLQKEFAKRAIPEWDGSVNAGSFDVIYPLAANMLHETAGSMFSEVHRDSYQRADEVSAAFCDQLNETFECTEEHAYEPLRIKSWVDMAVEHGGITVDENDMVHLTPLGEEMAQSVAREIER